MTQLIDSLIYAQTLFVILFTPFWPYPVNANEKCISTKHNSTLFIAFLLSNKCFLAAIVLSTNTAPRMRMNSNSSKATLSTYWRNVTMVGTSVPVTEPEPSVLSPAIMLNAFKHNQLYRRANDKYIANFETKHKKKRKEAYIVYNNAYYVDKLSSH